MKRLLLLSIVFLFAATGFASEAVERKSAQEAKALLDKAVAYYKADGKEKALAAFNDPQGPFIDGDLFIFALDENGVVVAHGDNQKLLGRTPNDFRDANEKNFIKELLQVAENKGTGTVDYKIGHPSSLVVEEKSSFVEKVDDTILGCGYFTAYDWQIFPHPASLQ